MEDVAQPISDLEIDGPFRLDIFHHGRRGETREAPRGSILRELIITLTVEIIASNHPAIKRPAEEELSLMIGDGQNQICCLLVWPVPSSRASGENGRSHDGLQGNLVPTFNPRKR